MTWIPLNSTTILLLTAVQALHKILITTYHGRYNVHQWHNTRVIKMKNLKLQKNYSTKLMIIMQRLEPPKRIYHLMVTPRLSSRLKNKSFSAFIHHDIKSLTSLRSKQGAKKVSFTASHSCKLQLACTSPRVINEQDWLQLFCNANFPKEIHLPIE